MTVPLPIDLHPFPFIQQTYYPHMSPEDTTLWNRFIETHPHFADFAYYDVPVGSLPHNIQSAQRPITERYVKQTYLKRIDALTQQDKLLHLIELKPYAGMIALGQVIMYRHCLAKLLGNDYNIHGMIISDIADVDLPELATIHQIQLLELDKP